MINEFDKEMDVILRKARGDEAAASFDSHLDADTLSAFAENALPDRSRQKYVDHLADCTRCRKILSNVIAFNAQEATSEKAFSAAAAPEKIPVRASVPWYRRLFVFPQLAYTMGALVAVFGGFLGYLALQNMTGSGGADVSFTTGKRAPSAEAPVFSGSGAANSNAGVMSNTSTANSVTNTVTNTLPVGPPDSRSGYSSNSAASKPAFNPELPTQMSNSTATTAATPQPLAQEPLAESAARDDVKNLADKDQPREEAENTAAGSALKKEKSADEKAPSSELKRRSSNAGIMSDAQRMPVPAQPAANPKSLGGQNPAAGQARFVGGKTFNNVGGIWFDSAYNKQKQKTVGRGSGDYQKLDSGLRSIADALSGTVVIIWKGKAYRIQ